jgi:hypothetical protein
MAAFYARKLLNTLIIVPGVGIFFWQTCLQIC